MAGRDADGAAVAVTAAPGGLLSAQPDFALALAHLLDRTGRATDGLLFSQPHRGDPDGARAAAEWLRVPALVRARESSEADAAQLEAQLRAVIDIEGQGASPNYFASGWYNLAVFLRQRWRVEEAVAAFEAAASEGRPPYRDRGYFHRERAGMLFEAGRSAEAAAAYREALGLPGDTSHSPEEVEALLADALMFAGEYRAAHDAFAGNSWLKKPQASEWRLKRLALHHLLTHVQVDRQQRERQTSMAASQGTLAAEAVDQLLAADALDPQAWASRALLDDAAGDASAAFHSLVLVAVIVRHVAAAWVMALSWAVRSGASASTLADVVHTALFFCGDDFTSLIDEAGQVVELEPEEAAKVRATAYRHAVTAPRPRRPILIRQPGLGPPGQPRPVARTPS